MSEIKIVPVSGEEIEMINDILEQMSHGVDDDDKNLVAVITLNQRNFESFISLVKKINNIE